MVKGTGFSNVLNDALIKHAFSSLPVTFCNDLLHREGQVFLLVDISALSPLIVNLK
jgi:hypothetical protein